MRLHRALLTLCLVLLAACARSPKQSTDPWSQWYQMQLPVKLANARVAADQARIFTRFQKKVQSHDYRHALALLRDPGLNEQGKAWAKVLSAQLAGLHTRACEAGQWLYFGEPDQKPRPRLSMLTLLDELAPLTASQDNTLATQAKTAAVRVMVIARDCPGAKTVQAKASSELPALLGELADSQASGLPPDLAYLWATMFLEQGQWSEARHWLKVAKDQGLDDPRITLANAQAHYGEQDFDQAMAGSVAAARAIPKGFARPAADAWTLAARSAFALGDQKLATQHLKSALRSDQEHPGAWALKIQIHSQNPNACQSTLPGQLLPLWKMPWTEPPTLLWLLDDLLLTLDEEGQAPLACLTRALVWNIDQEQDPALRGIRYYYAATLDTRLGNLQSAMGRALLARTEFESAGSPRHPLPIEALIEALARQTN